MRRVLSLGILGCLILGQEVRGQQAETPGSSTTTPVAKSSSDPGEQAKLLEAVRDALDRNAREMKALKEQYAKDLEEQRKTIGAQQKQIEDLQRSASLLQDKIGKAPSAANQQKVSEIQQKQLEVLEEQSQLVADQVEKQAPVVDKLQTQAATLDSRSKQGAQRDNLLADSLNDLRDSLDSQRRGVPWLPNGLKQLYVPSGTNTTPVSMYSTLDLYYNNYPSRRGAGEFSFDQYTPFFLYQLNKWMLLEAEVTFNTSGASLGQAQIDMFLNDWLTASVGYFLAPVGFMSERLDPVWINKLPDLPLSMLQVIPDGLALMGLQFRGAKYIAGSPIKMEYSAYMTNGLGVPGQGKAADWYDQGAILGTSGTVNQAMAYGGRLGFWIPAVGVNFGVSEFVNAPYSADAGAVMSIWQPYFNYHRGNWDFRFEYGDNFERTKQFIGNNIHREGFYTQLAYRDYNSIKKHLQRLEYVGRFSEARFQGINQASITPSAFEPPASSPVNRNQYTLGVNYYLYASTILKFAFEFNQELKQTFRDNVFIMQFATNF